VEKGGGLLSNSRTTKAGGSFFPVMRQPPASVRLARLACLAIVLIAAAGPVLAQRHKLDFDPESKEGYLLEQIQQTPDPAGKLQLLEQFIAQYPNNGAIAWVYEQIESLYMSAQQYNKELEIGPKMLAADPGDLETAEECLRAANALKKLDEIAHFAELTWRLGTKRMQSVTPNDPHAEYAKNALAYAEYSEFALASAATDPKRRLEVLHTLETWNPHSQYLEGGEIEAYRSYRQMGQNDKAMAVAERIAAKDPGNVDALMAIAEYHFKKEDNPDKVVATCTKIADLLEGKTRPEKFTAEEWEKKRALYLGSAHYMCGFVSSLRGNYALADRHLRAALPYLKGNPQLLAPALYHLGYANYKLAEKGEKGRVMDALKFTHECAVMSSSFQEQAVKNIEAIKSEYNLQ